LGFKERETLIGTFANFRPQKNHANLIKAVGLLKASERENLKFLLCGSGPAEPEIKKLTQELGVGECIRFMGIRLDIPKLMNTLDVYCLPSHYEGLPLSILEAMASSKPIIATNVDGNKDILEHEKTAILVEPNSPQDLARNIGKLIENRALRENIACRAYECVQKFSFDRMIKNYEELFNRTLASTFELSIRSQRLKNG